MWKLHRSSHIRARKDYWARIADDEFESMDAEGQAQWSELRTL